MWDKYRFECQRCGDCCTRPGYFTPDTLEDAAASMEIDKRTFYREFCDIRKPGQTVIKPKILDSGYCIFLDTEPEEKSCRIHDFKPRNCKYSPLVPEIFNSENGRIFINKHTIFKLWECPGTGKGRLHKVKEVVVFTEMIKDYDFQGKVLEQIAEELGKSEFVSIIQQHDSGRTLSQVEADNMRKAVEKAYDLYYFL